MNSCIPSVRAAYSPRRNGSALVITLAVLVLMSIMVISLSDTTRIERGSARSHLEKARAEMLAQTGAAKVLASLRKETADPGRNWISQPGQLVASDPGTSSAKTVIDPAIPLSSGAPVNVTSSSVPAVLRPAQLNVPTFEQGGGAGTIPPHLITNLPDPNDATKAVPMVVRWIYVRKDGSEDLAEQPVMTNTANPIVGRYAYWTDDESSKVNYNLAWTRGSNNPNPASHPTRINLPTIFGPSDLDAEAKAAAIHLYNPDPLVPLPPAIPKTTTAYRALNRFFFQTPEDARQVERAQSGVDTALLAAKFNVTHYNHDPDTTFFNEPRIVLTTRKSRAGNRPFLDIGITDDDDLWDLSKIANSKLTTTINKLNSYLQRTDWPVAAASAPSASFQSKYYANNAARLTQLSLNILDYVRSKESSHDIVVPLRGEYLSKIFTVKVGIDSNSYIGVARTPRITEMGIWIPGVPTSVTTTKTTSPTNTTTTRNYTAHLKVEIYLPQDFGIDSLDLTKLTLYQDTNVDCRDGDSQSLHVGGETTIAASEVTIPGRPGITAMRPGDRAVITRNVSINYVTKTNPEQKQSRPSAESKARLRIAIGLDLGATNRPRLDITPLLGSNPGDFAVCKVNAPDVAEIQMPSIEVDDPRINAYKGDWKDAIAFPSVPPDPPNAPNTFGAKNSVSKIGAFPDTAILPEQDTNRDGMITDVSLVMPAPAGIANAGLSSNPNGVMASVGELGFISTGMQSAGLPGMPWRTLHLQPSKQPTSVLPDWAFMDLFTVPADVPPDVAGKPSPKAIYSPHSTATGGRVNMNAKPEPFDLDRLDPLMAVFEGASYDARALGGKLSRDQARTIAEAVYYRKLAKARPTKGKPDGKQFGYQNGYDSPGEVVEIEGVADGGEESEQLVREVANLITSRGNVFSVYTVGQALKQTPAGQLVVTGEQRQQSMVERYADGATIDFRPIYFRNLTP